MRTFIEDETGQDLIEYSLLLAFVGLVAVALVHGVGRSAHDVWDETSEVLQVARQSVRGRRH